MMKKFVVYGAGEFADIVSDLIERVLQYTVEAYILDDEYINAVNKYNGKEVVPASMIKEKFSPLEYDVAIGFIGKDMFNSRKRVFDLLKCYGYKIDNLIHPSAIISTSNIGDGNIILENCVIGYNVKFGNGNIMWPLSSANHHNIVGNFNNFAPGASTSGGVIIGNHCFLGNNSTYNNKVTVSDYTFVGAGAYIAKNTESYGVYVPEKSIKINKTADEFY
ncbi:MAG: acetyltransferase [Ruminococcaceae bacterium]|nr:acetyltransferase [Oscillospiraceae bacterium]